MSLALQSSQPAPVHAVLLVLMALEAWVVQQIQMGSECDNSFTLQQEDVCEPCVAFVTANIRTWCSLYQPLEAWVVLREQHVGVSIHKTCGKCMAKIDESVLPRCDPTCIVTVVNL